MRFWSIFDPPDGKKYAKTIGICVSKQGRVFLCHDRSWDRFWTNFGSILAPKIRPNRPQEDSKVDQKSDRKTCWVWDRFWNDFFLFFGQNGGTFSRRSNLKNLKNGLKMWSKPSGSLLGPILDQFWFHFGTQNPTRSAPRGFQNRSKKWSKNLLSLGLIF